ncbi:transthyretin-like family protein [Calycomorphotria hydatis]|uniref:Nickel uptake substrate-specific transmembrane region n=1 Tax=Calycomorphotria hydatis TaxID=2528027 RepID=A0A517TDR1_9PLAN|nr:carboxypeptidase-like regulatory domain-containing protein [Calycomorphotria hydatis]QDT66509.1 hypothetical protein V22_37770 [Calycomorphotria hydatis]
MKYDRMNYLRRIELWGALSAAMCIGCWSDSNLPELAEVTGTVLLDGEPVPNARLQFLPAEGRPSYGKTDEDGQFRLRYNLREDGAVLGNHRVEITTEDLIEDAETEKSIKVPERIPKKYNVNSELVMEVAPGYNDFTIELVGQ